MAPKCVREHPECAAEDGGRDDARQKRAEIPQEVRRPLDEYDFIPLLVADVVLLGDLQDLLAQKKHIAVEDTLATGSRRPGHAVLPAALRALHKLARKRVLQFVGSSALTQDALGHGCRSSG